MCVSLDGKSAFKKSAFSPSSNDKTVRAWDLASGRCVAVLKGHTDWVTSVCVSVDGKALYSSSNDKTVRVWDLATGMCIAVLEGHSGGEV